MRRRLNAPRRQLTRSIPIAAPQRGINAVDPLASMNVSDCIFSYNMIPTRYGMRVRSGYSVLASNIGSNGVRTLMPFTGTEAADNRLFVTSTDGIFDETTPTDSPVAVLAFATTTGNAGYGIHQSFRTIADQFLIYCDEVNGYHLYTESTASWAAVATGAGPTQVSGVTTTNLVAACVYKSRVWFVERDSGNAYYLAVGSVYGAATQFAFGNKFKSGGYLVNLFNWTVDGGEGVDDYLVAVSSSGDVIVYRGNDPSSATDFVQVGQWFIGPPPINRRIAGSFGGELYVLSSYGIIPMSKLVSGVLIQSEDIYVSRRINPLLNEQMSTLRNSRGWEFKLIPGENSLICSVPAQATGEYIQFVQSLNNQAWTIYRGIPYFTGDTWLGNFYIGTTDGRLLQLTGNLDNTSQIDWSLLMSFQDFGEPGAFNVTQYIRPVFVASSPPSYVVEAKYDYNLDETFGATDASVSSASVWDSATWNSSVWAGDFQVIDNVRGGSGLGRAIAVGMNGRSQSETTLVRFDLMIQGGGFL